MIFIANSYGTDVTFDIYNLLLYEGIGVYIPDPGNVTSEYRQISHRVECITDNPPHSLCSAINSTILFHYKADTVYNDYSVREETLHAAYQ